MGYNEWEIELRKTLAQIARWREMGYMPAIEQNIALARLQRVYAELMETRPNEPQPEEGNGTEQANSGWNPIEDEEVDIEVAPEPWEEATQEPQEEIAQEEVVYKATDEQEPEDEEEASEVDESFETPDSEATNERPGDDDGNFADLSAKEEDRHAVESHLEQEVGSKDFDPIIPVPGDERPKATIFDMEVSEHTRHKIVDTLFRGDNAFFAREEEKFAAMPSLEEALFYIGETYNWIPENTATIQFIDLLEEHFNA